MKNQKKEKKYSWGLVAIVLFLVVFWGGVIRLVFSSTEINDSQFVRDVNGQRIKMWELFRGEADTVFRYATYADWDYLTVILENEKRCQEMRANYFTKRLESTEKYLIFSRGRKWKGFVPRQKYFVRGYKIIRVGNSASQKQVGPVESE